MRGRRVPERVLISKNEKSLHILFLEEDPARVRLVDEVLTADDELRPRHDICILHARSVDQLQELGIAIAVVDVALVNLNVLSMGMDSFHQIRAAIPGVPIVLLCDETNADLAATLLNEGAQDHVLIEALDTANGQFLMRILSFAADRHKLNEEIRNRLAASEFLQIAKVLTQACRVPCGKLTFTLQAFQSHQSRAILNQEHTLRETQGIIRAISDTLESIASISLERQVYSVTELACEFATIHRLQYIEPDSPMVIGGCPDALRTALEFLHKTSNPSRPPSSLKLDTKGSSCCLEIHPETESAAAFHTISLNCSSLRDLTAIFAARIHNGSFHRNRETDASRFLLPLESP